MSILIKEDYVNPTKPLWALAGSGGGGGNNDPLIVYTLDPNVNVGVDIGTGVQLQTIPIPSAYGSNDNFIFTTLVELSGIGYTQDCEGYLRFEVVCGTQKTFTNIYIYNRPNSFLTNIENISFTVNVLIANRGDSSNLEINVTNYVNDDIVLTDILYTDTYFYRLSTAGTNP